MAKSFVPDLLALRETAEQGDAPVLRIWTRLSAGVGLAQTSYPDEEDVLGALTADFRSDALNGLFYFGQPKPIAEIRERHARVMRAPVDHVLAISREQYGELLRLASVEPELEKRRSVLDRAEARRRALLLNVMQQMDELEMKAEEVLFFETFPSPELRKVLLKGQRRSALELKEQVGRKLDLLKTTGQEAHSILDELKLLEAKLAVIRASKAKLTRLKARIDQAPAERTQEAQEKVVPKVVTSPNPTLSRDASGGTKKRLGEKASTSERAVATPPKEEIHPMQTSLDRVRDAVVHGNEVGSLRLVIPLEGNVHTKLKNAWTSLLNELGFKGRLVLCAYESLDRDGSTPLIMPRKMYTHMNFWTPSLQENIFIIDFAQPALLLRLHQEGKL